MAHIYNQQFQLVAIGMMLVSSLLVGCKELNFASKKEKSESAGAESGDQQSKEGRISKFTKDDISAVEIAPDELVATPWNAQPIYLAGVLPDESRGRIFENVTWKVSHPELAKIGSPSGTLLPIGPGTIEVVATYEKFSAKKSLKIEWPKGATNAQMQVPDVVAFSLNEAAGAKIQANFVLAKGLDQQIFAVKLLYKEGAVSPSSCENPDAQTTVISEEILKGKSSFVVNGLKPSTAYKFRACVIQTLKADSEMIQRSSNGVVVAGFSGPA